MQTARRVAVATETVGGTGRASAVAFGPRRDAVPFFAGVDAGPAGAAAEVRAAGGKALLNQINAADRREPGAGSEPVEQGPGPRLIAPQYDRFTGVGPGATLATITGVLAILHRKDGR